MKRLSLLLFTVLVVGLVVGLPWFFGGQARAAYDKALAGLPAQGIEVGDTRYTQGWITSEATTKLVLPSSQGRQPLAARAQSRIHHGPWQMGRPRLLPAAAFVETRFIFDLPEEPSFAVDTLVRLDGSTVTNLDLPAVSFALPDQALRIRSEPGRGELRVTSAGDRVDSDFSLPTLEIASAELGTLQLRDLRMNGGGERLVDDIFTGKTELILGELIVLGKDRVELGDLRLVAESRADDQQLLDTRAELGIARLRVNGEIYAPSLIELAIERLPARELAQLRRTLGGADQGDPAAAFAMMGALADAVPRLLAPDPRLVLRRLELTTPEGGLSARISLGVKGMESGMMMLLPMGWLQHLVGEGEIQAPAALMQRILAEQGAGAEAAAAQIEGLVSQGWLVSRGDRLVAALKLDGGLLTVNGNPMPLGLMGM